ncbi:uncharacterized protein LY79DRAFT_205632 [Colletotrichum navitas]|uniref:Uncharacterized protein n=1 Tax=Colletotrichum navitas TaxID=681940 RepID=A0AAD8QCW8_9PEZI|nr:uncharacterized protein LY79DRAFT_205632 [Colletotrichum navitas]KAK1599023.1 hypothetical protein LY79DRAFT_205632 [Colletotrichum navitas]
MGARYKTVPPIPGYGSHDRERRTSWHSVIPDGRARHGLPSWATPACSVAFWVFARKESVACCFFRFPLRGIVQHTSSPFAQPPRPFSTYSRLWMNPTETAEERCVGSLPASFRYSFVSFSFPALCDNSPYSASEPTGALPRFSPSCNKSERHSSFLFQIDIYRVLDMSSRYGPVRRAEPVLPAQRPKDDDGPGRLLGNGAEAAG